MATKYKYPIHHIRCSHWRATRKEIKVVQVKLKKQGYKTRIIEESGGYRVYGYSAKSKR